jgi:poly(3-hydroxyalkanoate) depolymerase
MTSATAHHRMVRAGWHNLRISVRDGSRHRPPLLLLSGLGASFEIFDPFVDAMDASTRIIRVDVPGVGLSTPPRYPYTMFAMAWLLAQVLDAIEEPVADVLGISWGGILAQQFAVQYPHRCERLVLASTCPGLGVPGAMDPLLALSGPDRHHDAHFIRSIAPLAYGGALRPDPSGSSVLASGLPPDGVGYRYQQLAAAGYTSLPFLPFLRQRTLVVAGDDDPLIPLANARLLASLIPDARLHIFADGHLGLLTGADELAPVIERFLDDGRPG